MTDSNDRREALLAGLREGKFLEAVYAASFTERDERDDLALELVALHNDGLVDIVAAFEALKSACANGPDFFLTRHVFEKALPHVNAPVAAVMRCVLQLCRDAGQDMAAGMIYKSYIEFCTKDPSRPQQALREIETNPDALVDLLPATIAAGSEVDSAHYLAEAIRLSQSSNLEMKRRATFSMARIKRPKGGSVPTAAIEALEQPALTETDDEVLAGLVNSAFALLQQDKALESRVIALVTSVLPKGGKYTSYAASTIFGLHTDEVTAPLLDVLLTDLRRVNPEHKGTIDNIDYGILHMLKRGDRERALQFLEELLVAHPEHLSMKAFDSAGAEIRQSRTLLSKVLTRWFVKGDRTLCEAAYELAGTHYGDDLRLDIDLTELTPLDGVRVIFVARKAIGYFFMKPDTAASIVISLMRYAPGDDVLRELGALLLNPLLMNYPGSMREYVAEQAERETGSVKATIQNALTAMEDYLEVLRAIPTLPALYPSEAHRESHRRHWSDSMAESMKAAEKKSVFYGLFAKNTLLYGRKSIDYVVGGDGEQHRTETPLQSHSVAMDFPRMDRVDPHGFDYMLRVFRLERFRS